MRLKAIAAAALIAAVGLSSAASAAPTAKSKPKPKPVAGSVTISEAPSSGFPDKAFVVSLPTKTRLTSGKLTVLENGEPVNGLTVQAPGTAGGNFGVILVIDASDSMAGKPIAGAMQAARTFAARRSPGQQLAVMTFNNATHVVLPFTNDGALITKALAKTPQLATGTHIYDAIQAAQQEIVNSGVTVASMVLLSDGRDVGSTVSPDTALAAATTAKTRIFSVGLESRQFDPKTLDNASTVTGGTFSIASNASQLSKIYSALGYALSNEYLIHYRSLAGPEQRIKLTVRVAGFKGTARTAYTTPTLSIGRSEPFVRSRWDRIVQSTTTAALVVSALVLLVGLAVFLMLRQRDRRFERRLGEFVSLPLEEQARRRRADVTAALAEKRSRLSLDNFAWYSKLEQDVELARIEILPSTIVFLTIILGLVIGIAVAAYAGTPFGLLAGLIAREPAGLPGYSPLVQNAPVSTTSPPLRVMMARIVASFVVTGIIRTEPSANAALKPFSNGLPPSFGSLPSAL